MKKTLVIIAIILVGGIVVLVVSNAQNRDGDDSSPSRSLALQGEEISVLGREHVPEGTKVTNYNSNPPTSGDHWPEPANWGFYDTPLPDEQLVHNLEHGGIWISYKDIDDDTKEQLRNVAGAYPQAVIITPRAKNDTAMALASWGRLQKLDSYNEEIIENFINANINNAPEPLASAGQMVVTVGNHFPEFSVTDVDGDTVTRDSLGSPSIVWFTTSWCVPCQIGAREVAQLDDELGGDAFDVLVIFVDATETDEDLRWWKDNFANKDWIVAFDNGDVSIAERVDLKFLDTKFLLDEEGVIQNVDLQIADQEYLDIVSNATSET